MAVLSFYLILGFFVEDHSVRGSSRRSRCYYQEICHNKRFYRCSTLPRKYFQTGYVTSVQINIALVKISGWNR